MSVLKYINIDISHLKCPVCMDIFEEPVITPCPDGCIVCKKCLTNWWDGLTPLNNDDEVEKMKRCFCGVMTIKYKYTRAVGIERLIKNVK